MAGTGLRFDAYTRRARLIPAALAVLPAVLAGVAWLPDGFTGLRILLGILGTAGIAAVIGQVARDAGKAKEAGLYEAWGGSPTVRLLRHRDAPNKVILERRHRFLEDQLRVKFPTPDEEQANRRRADATYEAAVLHLREATRDRTKFPLVFEENVNYGMRRNMLGLRTWALLIAVASIIMLPARLYLFRADALVIACLAMAVVTGMFWAWVVTPAWVKRAAEAYAERLLGACDLPPSWP